MLIAYNIHIFYTCILFIISVRFFNFTRGCNALLCCHSYDAKNSCKTQLDFPFSHLFLGLADVFSSQRTSFCTYCPWDLVLMIILWEPGTICFVHIVPCILSRWSSFFCRGQSILYILSLGSCPDDRPLLAKDFSFLCMRPWRSSLLWSAFTRTSTNKMIIQKLGKFHIFRLPALGLLSFELLLLYSTIGWSV